MILKIFIYLVLVGSCGSVLACNAPTGEQYPVVKNNDGYMSFEKKIIPQDDGGNGVDKGIAIFFEDCEDGKKKSVGDLPFLAETGRVVDAFFAEVDSEQKFFVIHNVLIRSETQPGDTGDYYSVLVYRHQGSSYVEDTRLSNYFGKGSDIRDGLENGSYAYVYPYKTRKSITDRIATTGFKRWDSGGVVHLLIKSKTNIYEVPSIATKTRMYLVPGDQVLQQEVEAGWVSIVYETKKHKTISGWVPCVAVGGCEL